MVTNGSESESGCWLGMAFWHSLAWDRFHVGQLFVVCEFLCLESFCVLQKRVSVERCTICCHMYVMGMDDSLPLAL